MTVAMGSRQDRFNSMARQMGKWVDQVLGPGYQNYSPSEAWSPAINLYEDDRNYYLVMDLAGVRPEAIDMRGEPEKGVLVIRGERANPWLQRPAGHLRMHLMEIDHGRFCRTVKIPPDVDLDQIEGSYRGGYLWVRMPKRI